MFGVAPPQTLFHTRQMLPTPPSSFPSGLALSAASASTASPPQSPARNPNQSAYSRYQIKAQKRRASQRPGTSESAKALLPFGGGAEGGLHRAETRGSLDEGDVYVHYRNSLNSLRGKTVSPSSCGEDNIDASV